MNELYNSNSRPRYRAPVIFILIVLVIMCVLMIMPGGATARLSLVISHEHPAEVVLTPPRDCRLEMVYLKANEHVPRQGKLVTLVVNGLKFPVADFEKLSECNAPADANCENRIAPIDWQKLQGAKTLAVSYEDVNKKMQRYDLELVFQLHGNPDKIKNWQSFVKLHSKDDPAVIIRKSTPEAEKSKQ